MNENGISRILLMPDLPGINIRCFYRENSHILDFTAVLDIPFPLDRNHPVHDNVVSPDGGIAPDFL
jgi:hypothetical protein